jgi:hypothetical protein
VIISYTPEHLETGPRIGSQFENPCHADIFPIFMIPTLGAIVGDKYISLDYEWYRADQDKKSATAARKHHRGIIRE